MSYGTIKIDTITFTDGGVDKSVSVSGFIQNPTITGNISVTGTISGNLIEGQTISGTTVTGNTGVFTTVTGGSAGFTTVTGTTVTGTTANFATLSGTTITGSVGNFGSGSAAAPSVSVGTTNNGVYSPGTNQVAISTSGSGRLFINSTGDIQVGAASTLNAAVLTATADATAKNLYIAFNGTTTGADFLMGGISANANGTNIGAVDIYRGSSDDHGYISFRTKNGTTLGERLRITADGKLGLGTIDPNQSIDIYGSGTSTSQVAAITLRDGNSVSSRRWCISNGAGGNQADLFGKLVIGYGSTVSANPITGTAAVVIDSTGKVGLQTTSPWSLLTVGTGGTANPAATTTIHQNTYSEHRLKLTSSGFNVDGRWLGLGFGYSDNYLKSAIIAEAKDIYARTNLHFCTEATANSTNVGLTNSRMVVTYDGNIGIGNTGPGSALVVSKTGSILSGTANTYGLYINPISSGYIYIDALTGTTANTSLVLRTYNNGTYNNLIQSISGNETTFSVGGNEAVRIDASRRLLVGLDSTSYGAIGSIVQRASGTSATPNVFRAGGWSICSIHGEPGLVLSSNVSAAGSAGSSETARGGIGFEYINSGQPTRMVIGTVVASTVPSPVTFWSEGTERMRIDTSGVFTCSTNVSSNGSTIIQGYYSEPNHINIIGSQYSSAATAICYAVRPKNGSAGYVSAAGNSSFAKGVIELDGNCVFKFASAATVAIGTDVSLTEVARFTTTGLTFNGDTAAANALDDYEEGTWTPTISSGGSALTIDAANCIYVKVGSMVVCQFELTGITSPNGNTLILGGFPFAPVTEGTFPIMTNNVTFPTSMTMLTGYYGPSQWRIYGSGSGTGWVPVTGNDMGSGDVIGTISYRAA